MHVPRLARKYLVFGFAIRVLLLHPNGIAAQQLVLPDIVLPESGRGDIPLPEEFTVIDDIWNPPIPRFRRIYSINLEPRDAAWETVVLEDLPILELVAWEKSSVSASVSRSQKVGWETDISVDVVNKVESGVSVRIHSVDRITADIAFDFSNGGAGDSAAVISWNHLGVLSVHAALGARRLQGPIPTAFVDVVWDDGGVDSYHGRILGFSDGAGTFSGSTGLIIDLPLRGFWRLRGEADVGIGVNNGVSFVRVAAAVGRLVGESSLFILGGVDGAYDGFLGIFGAPYLRMEWLSLSGIGLSFWSGLKTGVPEIFFDALVWENIVYRGDLPLRAEYGLGVVFREQGPIIGGISVGFSHGTFVAVQDATLRSVNDMRVTGEGEISISAGSGRIQVDAEASFSLQELEPVWSGRLGYFAGAWFPFLKIGSENTLLSFGIPGMRAHRPIMGLGIEWNLSKSWQFGAFGYSGIPLNLTSIIVQMKWSQ